MKTSRVVTALALAYAVLLMGSSPASSSQIRSLDEQDVAGTQLEVSTRDMGAGYENAWLPFRGAVKPGSLKAVVTRHTVYVVPVEPDPPRSQVPKEVRQEVLDSVASFWAESVPGLSIRFIQMDAVTIPESACNDYAAVWAAAKSRMPAWNINGSSTKHLAGIADCNGLLAGGVATGNSFVTVGWGPTAIAHEFGHAIGIRGHSNGLNCPSGSQPSPGACTQIEYADPGDIMGRNSALVSRFKTGVNGLWRALLLGVQRIPPGKDAIITLDSASARTQAKPLLVNSKIGPIFLDATARSASDGLAAGEFCEPVDVSMRVGTNAEASRYAGAGMRQVRLPTGQETFEAYLLDSFAIPGTSRRVVVTRVSNSTATIRLISASDAARPMVPDLSGLESTPFTLFDTAVGSKGRITLPTSPDVLGYVIESPESDCDSRVLGGGTVDLPLSEGQNEVLIRTVGHNGMAVERSVVLSAVRVDTSQ